MWNWVWHFGLKDCRRQGNLKWQSLLEGSERSQDSLYMSPNHPTKRLKRRSEPINVLHINLDKEARAKQKESGKLRGALVQVVSVLSQFAL
jgi:hypothetical protein